VSTFERPFKLRGYADALHKRNEAAERYLRENGHLPPGFQPKVTHGGRRCARKQHASKRRGANNGLTNPTDGQGRSASLAIRQVAAPRVISLQGIAAEAFYACRSRRAGIRAGEPEVG
jgi:hypothetical protein